MKHLNLGCQVFKIFIGYLILVIGVMPVQQHFSPACMDGHFTVP
jgi:hypothetical protein